MRIAKADNTGQYWPNLGSQESAIVIGPVLPFASVKCWAVEGGLCRLFKFTDLQPKLGPVSALYQARCCAENKCWRPEFGPELATKCIPELLFQQRHVIGNRSSPTFLPVLGQCWTVLNFTLGYSVNKFSLKER